MRETIGGILTAGGLLGLLYYGYQYYEHSESFEVFGADMAVSTGNHIPIIISGLVFIAGLFIAKLNIK